MNQWEVVAAALGFAFIPCLGVCALAGVTSGLAALEVAGVLSTTVLMVLSEGLQRQSFVDLALVFALLSLVGALAFARLMERDL
jgi:multisubunit Na+/H+ antiporter MnhF subunit